MQPPARCSNHRCVYIDQCEDEKGDVPALSGKLQTITLTSLYCKHFEYIICKHLLNHIEKIRYLGFRSRFSCKKQVLVSINDLLNNNEQGSQTDNIILDFSKAFGTVSNDELLCKLESYGTCISGPSYQCLYIFLNGESSNKVTVDSRVPQGTIISLSLDHFSFCAT